MSSPYHELLALLRLALPLIGAQLAYVAMVFTDTLMMGRLGPAALAGGGLGAAVYSFVSVICVGVITAVANLAALRRGAGDARGVAAVTAAGIWIALALAVVAGSLLWHIEPLLALAGQPEESRQAAGVFLRCLAFALPGHLLFMTLRGFTSALDRPGPVLVIVLGAAALNALFNLALLQGWGGLPRPGLAGIGAVTALVMNGAALCLALYIARHPAYAAYPLARYLRRPDRRALTETLGQGLAISGTYAVEACLFLAAALCMGALGATALAANQIANQLVYLVFMLPAGLSYATSIRIGQHQGAGRPRAALLVGRLALASGALLGLGVALVFWLLPTFLVSLFLPRATDSALFDLACTLVSIAAWFVIADGLQAIAQGALRGIGQARLGLLGGLLCYCLVGALGAWLFGVHLGYGPRAVWWSLALGLACAALLLMLLFEALLRRQLPSHPAGRAGDILAVEPPGIVR
ncbi:MAG: NorM family multidrug efflux MATE transporter [Pseudomonas oryzihabitans]